jgi:hypothetical protein
VAYDFELHHSMTTGKAEHRQLRSEFWIFDTDLYKHRIPSTLNAELTLVKLSFPNAVLQILSLLYDTTVLASYFTK